MSERAKNVYMHAFEENRYEKYQSLVNDAAKRKIIEEDSDFKHMAVHDVESFVWVLIHELLLAWPKDSDIGLTYYGYYALRKLEEHTFGPMDYRFIFLEADHEDWKTYLHPALACLADTLVQMSNYIAHEWAHWPELPEDHAHEAIAILLVEMACIIEDKGDIELRETHRDSLKTPPPYLPDNSEVTPERPKEPEQEVEQSRAVKKRKVGSATKEGAQA